MAKRMVRVYNITHIGQPPKGYMLDYDGKMFAPGRQPIDVELEGSSLPEPLKSWRESTPPQVRILDAESGDEVCMSPNTQPILTAGSRVQEVAAVDMDLEDDEFGFDPADAREAALPGGAHSPSLQQQSEKRAKVSLGTEEEKVDDATILSPIPGSRPRNVDNSDAFTIRAPRSSEQGGIISGR